MYKAKTLLLVLVLVGEALTLAGTNLVELDFLGIELPEAEPEGDATDEGCSGTGGCDISDCSKGSQATHCSSR